MTVWGKGVCEFFGFFYCLIDPFKIVCVDLFVRTDIIGILFIYGQTAAGTATGLRKAFLFLTSVSQVSYHEFISHRKVTK